MQVEAGAVAVERGRVGDGDQHGADERAQQRLAAAERARGQVADPALERPQAQVGEAEHAERVEHDRQLHLPERRRVQVRSTQAGAGRQEGLEQHVRRGPLRQQGERAAVVGQLERQHGAEQW